MQFCSLLLTSHDHSHGGHSAVKANLGANEGHLFLLEKSCLYISKAPVCIPYNDITEIRFERVSGALTSSARTFDLIIATRTGKNEHTFSAVAKEEQSGLEDFLKRDKKLRVKNVIDQDVNAVNSAVVAALMEDDSDDDERERRPAGDDDEDSEVDEDFKAGSDDDDVAEEFNEVSNVGIRIAQSSKYQAGRTTPEARPPAHLTMTLAMVTVTTMMKRCRRQPRRNQRKRKRLLLKLVVRRRRRPKRAIESLSYFFS